MDAFKLAEVKRMEYGGNRPWKDFFNNHQSNKLIGRDFESCTIAERYDSEAGEEWKDRLTAKVEGTEYVPGSSAKPRPVKKETGAGVDAVSSSGTPAGSGRNTPLGNARIIPQRAASPSQKARNEAFFASKGSENASRPNNLPPSQGGKYGGFGSNMGPNTGVPDGSEGIPTSDEFQRDPMAAITKGFGWLSSTVTKQAATVNRSYIQPGMKSIQDGEFAAQARATAVQAGSYVQQGAKGMGDQFNRFVDPDASPSGPGGARRAEPEKKDFWDSFGQDPSGPPQEKKDFWDDFAAAGDVATQSKQQQTRGPTNIGTSAMKTGGGGGGSGKKEEGDGWGDW